MKIGLYFGSFNPIHAGHLIIAQTLFQRGGLDQVWFVVSPQNQAVLRPVRLGLRLAGKAEVLSGVEPGEKVVVEGVKKIFPGAPLKLSGPESAAPYQQ